MNKYLDETLMDDEMVVWQGKSEPFKVLSGPYEKRLPGIWAICAVVVVVLAALWVHMLGDTALELTQIVMGGIMIGIVPLSIFYHSFSDSKIIQKEMEYALTNYRAIAVRGNNGFSMEINENTPYRVEMMDDGTGIIYIGDGCQFKASVSREKTVLGIYADGVNSGKVTGMVFYGVKDADSVCKEHAVFA